MLLAKEIKCTACKKTVKARLTYGKEIYPHRPDLSELPYWKCDDCGNYVGCHHKTDNPTRPLGVIPTSELKKARTQIHALLDPLWKVHGHKRSMLYRRLSDALGWKYHTANIRSIDEARTVYREILKLKKELAA